MEPAVFTAKPFSAVVGVFTNNEFDDYCKNSFFIQLYQIN